MIVCVYCDGALRTDTTSWLLGMPGARRTRYTCTHPCEVEITTVAGFTVATWMRLDDSEWQSLGELVHEKRFQELWRPPAD